MPDENSTWRHILIYATGMFIVMVVFTYVGGGIGAIFGGNTGAVIGLIGFFILLFVVGSILRSRARLGCFLLFLLLLLIGTGIYWTAKYYGLNV